jgi:hypothetical protein
LLFSLKTNLELAILVTMNQDSELVASVKHLAHSTRVALLDYQQAVLAHAEKLQAELEEGKALLVGSTLSFALLFV